MSEDRTTSSHDSLLLVFHTPQADMVISKRCPGQPPIGCTITYVQAIKQCLTTYPPLTDGSSLLLATSILQLLSDMRGIIALIFYGQCIAVPF